MNALRIATNVIPMQHVWTLQVLTTVSVEVDTLEMAALAQVYDFWDQNAIWINNIIMHLKTI
jgi:hypothetical protein